MKLQKVAYVAAVASMWAALIGGLAVVSSTPGIDDGAGLEQHSTPRTR